MTQLLDDLSALMASTDISGVTQDSRAVRPGWLFCCVRGMNSDGHDYASAAIERGAAALLVERPLGLGVPELLVPDVRSVLGEVSALVYGNPSDDIKTIGVTGTSGKTSIVHILAAILERSGRRFDTLGTLSGARTTPEAPELQATLRAAADTGKEVVAMEVSSHALALGRVNGMTFSVSVFTNLGHDHLDFHPTMEDYFAAKSKLFLEGRSEQMIVNVDDEHGALLIRKIEEAGGAARAVSLGDVEDLEVSGPISSFRWRDQPVTLQLAGRHNVINAILAAEAAVAVGVELEDIADGLCAVDPPPGRMEWVNAGQSFKVVVDYAHKPEALRSVLQASRDVVGSGRVLLVVGCGGDRDAQKRPIMGRIAEEGADLVILTSDNPRSEDPMAIINAISAGMENALGAVVIEDRAEAIRFAVGEAAAADLVLIAGKGHETTQVVGSEVLEFDDRVTAFRALEHAG